MASQGTTFYSGKYRHSLDDKNRVTIPSGWRYVHAVDDEFLAVPQNDHAGNRFIAVLPPDRVASIRAKAAQIPISDTRGRQAITRFFANSHTFTFDKQGRVALTAEHCQHAGISKDAVLAGSGDNFVIYNPETWERVSTARPGDDDNATLAQLGI